VELKYRERDKTLLRVDERDMRVRRIVPAILAMLLLIGGLCHGQSLGEAARQIRQALATSYKEALPTEGWLPGRAVGDLVGIQLLEGRRFKLRSIATGREAVAVATTSLAPGGGIISTIYVIDGTRLISVTARTENERDKVAFLGSLKLLQ